MSRRSRFGWFGAAALLVVLGAASAVTVSGTAGAVIAFVLIALGLVLATSLAFLEVGLSEDRARARDERRASLGGRPKPRVVARPGKLDRSRGRRRRLR
ncbi:MAG: hypothetical protein ABI323_11690 [Solirubrobacteraceae bacterium]